MAKTGAWLLQEIFEVETMTDDILDIQFDDEKNTAEYYLKTLYNLLDELKVYIEGLKR